MVVFRSTPEREAAMTTLKALAVALSLTIMTLAFYTTTEPILVAAF